LNENVQPRRIRSFVRREGRMTNAQRRALVELWPRYGIELGTGPIDLRAAFGREAPVHLEIGFGNGDALATMAAAHPENNYLGIEVHRPGIGHLLRRCAAEQLENVRVISADASEALERIAPGSIAAAYVFFPDPWPKKRHHKRRLVQPDFVALLRERMVAGGILRFATDWRDYAEQMLAVLGADPELQNLSGVGQYAARPPERPLTRFEQRGMRLGHAVWDLSFQRSRPHT